MIELRKEKIERIADALPPIEIDGPDSGELLVLGWGGTKGSITAAVQEVRTQGLSVSQVHLRHLNPLPQDLGEVLARYPQVLVPELNTGQLSMLLRSEYLVDAKPFTKVNGMPFMIAELVDAIEKTLRGETL